MFRRKLLVLSCPRSGSRYFRLVLNNARVEVNHEGMGQDGTVGMFFAVEDCWYPGKHWNDDLGYEDESLQRRSHYEFDQVWHLIRDPRDVIPSLVGPHVNGGIWVWQERHTGISCGTFPKILKAMRFWVAWNELIEKNAISYTLRVEDTERLWPEICRLLQIEDTEYPEVPKNTGHIDHGPNKSHRRMSFSEMIEHDAEAGERVMKLAQRYGYTEDS